jgi:hypothetical protein
LAFLERIEEGAEGVTVIRPIPLRLGSWRERRPKAFTRRSKGPVELHSSIVPRFSDLDRSLPVVLSGVLRGRGIPRQTLERDIARRAAQRRRPVQSIQPRRFRTAARASRAVFPPARCRIAVRIACAAPRARSNVGSSRIMIEPSLSSVRPGLPRRVTVTLRPLCTGLTTWNNCRRARVMDSFIATMIPQRQRRGHCGGF